MPVSEGELRHRAREAALQMLYQWEIGRTDINEVLNTYWTLEEAVESEPGPVRDMASRLALGTVEHLQALDPLIGRHAEHWRLSRMAAVDRAILRLAVYEFLHEPGTPRKVALDEALELAKTFSGDDAVGFVNGVLDAVLREITT